MYLPAVIMFAFLSRHNTTVTSLVRRLATTCAHGELAMARWPVTPVNAAS